ncbi:HVO_2922 family protein [Halorarius litoreus]|uniref:HVO_2922 family protein n=1 Tax=Halorarius litoreus TaxID=2962676 RepID=UPI0020CD10C1|nr:HVO_2922 family protein [Halorarius litoreus]
MTATFELYRDREGQYRWRLVHRNGNIIADSGEGYTTPQKARQGIDSVKQNAPDAPVESVDE